MKKKSLFERLALRFVGEGKEADRKMYVTVLTPEQAENSVSPDVFDDVLAGEVPGVNDLEDVVFFSDNGEFSVLVKPTRTVFVPSYRNLGGWDDITDHYDDETVEFILSGGVRDW